ncbi:predicted protein [Pyrenophora tritici-repentis Pt-1C-BFP]|uniref:Uncharacterized protein n=1 Tax=Pyrenophora tritici-repentis (strain Pt-1C-BFP) TaxID=426418 RepID=B2VZS4_PYRTR|nr:uncharacterized protein PTRG_02914 [Pyrenophora tritici-repentis Pt-1C-BFP]EDU45437.1 predicted protein [Pyrenophora tritici-repentis Pt-1C-BFP]
MNLIWIPIRAPRAISYRTALTLGACAGLVPASSTLALAPHAGPLILVKVHAADATEEERANKVAMRNVKEAYCVHRLIHRIVERAG